MYELKTDKSNNFYIKNIALHYTLDLPTIEKVITNENAVIIKWSDKTKTVVKRCSSDINDPEKGFLYAVIKKIAGDQYGAIKKHAPIVEKNKINNHTLILSNQDCIKIFYESGE